VIKWHIANGFNATVITGHNSLMPAKRTRDLARAEYDAELKVLLGMEWTNCRMHMNLIGIEHEPSNWKFPTDEQIQQVIAETHAQGGVVVLNHIPWSVPRMLDYPSKEQLAAWGVDYIEVASSEYFDAQTYLYVRDEHLGMITGTDMHYPEPGMSIYRHARHVSDATAVHAWTLLEAAEYTEEAIMQQLRDRRTSFIYDAYGRRG
jgi:predicted metal-dependent phosphoesterase TrpH